MKLIKIIFITIALLNIFSCRKDPVEYSIVLVNETFDKDLGINKTIIDLQDATNDTSSLSTVKIENGILKQSIYVKCLESPEIYHYNSAGFGFSINFDSIIPLVESLQLNRIEFIIKQTDNSKIVACPWIDQMCSMGFSSSFSGSFLNHRFRSNWPGLSGKTIYYIDLNQLTIEQTDDNIPINNDQGLLYLYSSNTNSINFNFAISVDIDLYSPCSDGDYGTGSIEIEYIQIIGYY